MTTDGAVLVHDPTGQYAATNLAIQNARNAYRADAAARGASLQANTGTFYACVRTISAPETDFIKIIDEKDRLWFCQKLSPNFPGGLKVIVLQVDTLDELRRLLSDVID